MQAVMYGAGNIGRGFIGPLFRKSGYHVTFVDVSEPLIEALNQRHQYPLRILSADGFEDQWIDGVDALNAREVDRVAEAIAGADIMATSVGMKVLPFILPNVVAGIRRRFAETGRPLNILLCENMMDADAWMAREIEARLTEAECELFRERVGLVETSIGRMVPVQTEAMQDGDPLRICVERYGFLPADKAAFKGPLPQLPALVPYTPFGYYLQRKLFLHNMGHALCAYLGLYTGCRYIWEALDDPEILGLVRSAMGESLRALSLAHGAPIPPLLDHREDLLLRMANRALGDTCARVGQDPARKLAANDRLVGAALLCAAQQVDAPHIRMGIAAALHRYLLEQNQPQCLENAASALEALAGIPAAQPLAVEVLAYYQHLRQGTRPGKLRRQIDSERAKQTGNIP